MNAPYHVPKHNVRQRLDGKYNLWRSFYDPVNREEIHTNWEVIGVYDTRERAWRARNALGVTQ